MTAGLDLVLITGHDWGQMSLSIGVEGLSWLVSAGSRRAGFTSGR